MHAAVTDTGHAPFVGRRQGALCDRINVTQRPGEQLPVLFHHIVVATKDLSAALLCLCVTEPLCFSVHTRMKDGCMVAVGRSGDTLLVLFLGD